MRKSAINRITGQWPAIIGRVFLTLSLIFIAFGAATAGGLAVTTGGLPATTSGLPPRADDMAAKTDGLPTAASGLPISGNTPTSDPTPTWSWATGGGEYGGNFRYKLDNANWKVTTKTLYTPVTALSEGSHTLYVQELDSVGNWSRSGAKVIVIDTTEPVAPVVSGTTPTAETTPTWTWVAGGGGNGTFRYNLDLDRMEGGTETTSKSYTSPNALTGEHTLYVQERDNAGNWSATAGKTIYIDTTKPTAPIVSGTSPTYDTTPKWTWASGGDGNGTFRYILDSTSMAGATVTTATTYTPAPALSEGAHTLYVQERDDAGNWSLNGSKTIVIDITKPVTPIVSGITPTNDTTPTWTWSREASGTGTFKYNLDNSMMTSAMVTTATTYTPASPLSEGPHTLYVQESDEAGNWSMKGSKTIVIKITKPATPIVNGTTQTHDSTPTWTWSSGKGGNGTFRFNLDNSVMGSATVTTATSYTPDTPLSLGSHTLYLQERHDSGNWSNRGGKTIEVLPPIVLLSTLPDTGQTASYTDTFGEDNDYTINPPSYTANGNGTVTDNVTGLMWQQHDDGATRNWPDAVSYCDNLVLGNYLDWRLPSKKELMGIVVYDHPSNSASIDKTAFPNTVMARYWTSTIWNANESLYFDFTNGGGWSMNKLSPTYARCVRGNQ